MKKLKAVVASTLFAVSAFAMSTPVFAAGDFSTGDNFTDIFMTRGFMGNAEILTKLSFVSALVSDIISICGFIGVALTVIRVMLSLLYLSNPVIFDEIDELKQSNTFQGGGDAKGNVVGAAKFFFGASINGVTQKSGGGIFDTIIYFLLGHMPNIKHYSDFSKEGNGDGNGAENGGKPNATKYILSISPKVIMQIFFFSIAWNGVLMQAYGSVVDAMGSAAERLVTDDFQVAVNNLLDTDSQYPFTFNASGTTEGDVRQNLAKQCYNELLKHMTQNSRNVENYYKLGDYVAGLINDLDDTIVYQVSSNGGTADSSYEEVTDDNTIRHVKEFLQTKYPDTSPTDYTGPIGNTDGTKYKITNINWTTDGNDNKIVGTELKVQKEKKIEEDTDQVSIKDFGDFWKGVNVSGRAANVEEMEETNWKYEPDTNRAYLVKHVDGVEKLDGITWKTNTQNSGIYLKAYITMSSDTSENYFAKDNVKGRDK